ncbi:MAG: 16S rRNA processing protein RimM [Acidobacteria bacterium]|nr:16S rRNA processing protein RimM [Acidobacteriota bacterium]
MHPQQDWVVLASIDRSRGRRGEVIVTSMTGGPESFLGRRVTILPAGGECVVEEAWAHHDRVVLKLSGVDTIEQAETLRGAELAVRPADRLPLGEGEYYLSDLVGCALIDGGNGESVGEVTGWAETLGGVLLTVQTTAGREALVPLVRSICKEIDMAGRRIVADLPAGLLDL